MIPRPLAKILQQARSAAASDVHICVGSPILFRIGRDLVPAMDGLVTGEISQRMVLAMLTAEQVRQFYERMDFDLVLQDDSGRYRVNIALNSGEVGAVIRLLGDQSRTLDELRLPPIVKKLAECRKGLLLITGGTSQGKTTTMSAIIHEINVHHRKHIITIENPIETVHVNQQSVVRQREVGRDTQTFASGLRAALRQDPDVVAIGEMRDYETIRIALTAAETGVLVLSTLHIISIDKLLERLLSYIPGEDEGHMRYLLAGTLQGVVHQELLPAVDGGKRLACEVLVGTDAVRNIIRRRDAFMLRSVIQSGLRYGMVEMKQSVRELLDEGAITQDVAQAVLVNY